MISHETPKKCSLRVDKLPRKIQFPWAMLKQKSIGYARNSADSTCISSIVQNHPSVCTLVRCIRKKGLWNLDQTTSWKCLFKHWIRDSHCKRHEHHIRIYSCVRKLESMAYLSSMKNQEIIMDINIIYIYISISITKKWTYPSKSAFQLKNRPGSSFAEPPYAPFSCSSNGTLPGLPCAALPARFPERWWILHRLPLGLTGDLPCQKRHPCKHEIPMFLGTIQTLWIFMTAVHPWKGNTSSNHWFRWDVLD